MELLQEWQTLIGAFLGFLAATSIKYWIDRSLQKRRREEKEQRLADGLRGEIHAIWVGTVL